MDKRSEEKLQRPIILTAFKTYFNHITDVGVQEYQHGPCQQ